MLVYQNEEKTNFIYDSRDKIRLISKFRTKTKAKMKPKTMELTTAKAPYDRSGGRSLSIAEIVFERRSDAKCKPVIFKT